MTLSQTRGPAGTPISTAFRWLSSPTGERVHRVLSAIDRVHGNGALPSIPVIEQASIRAEAWYDFSRSPEESFWIVVRPGALHLEFSIAHEAGHFLDHRGLGGGGTLGSESAILDRWRGTVRNSSAVQALDRLRSRSMNPIEQEHLDYLLSYHELWARAYAQFVASRSRDAALLDALKRWQRAEAGTIAAHRQWLDADFTRIGAAIDDAFVERGWLWIE